MKKFLILGLTGILTQGLWAADSNPKDTVVKATKQLADKGNYSWTTSNKEADGSQGRLGPIDGKTEQSGLVYLTFSVGGGGIQVDVYMKGEKGAAKALEGWQTFDDIAQTSAQAGAIVRFLRSYKVPNKQAAELAGKVSDLKESDGVVSGELKEDAVKEMLLQGGRRREGQEAPKIADPKGSVKFFVKDGLLTKYEINVQGKVTAGERENEVNRTTTVEIKDAGTTKLEVPAEAKEKLG